MVKQRRKYSCEFKLEAVRMVTEQGLSLREVATDLGIDRTMLRRWKQQLEAEGEQAFPGNGKTAESDELRKLREENRKLRMERDILKKAAAFFAKENQ